MNNFEHLTGVKIQELHAKFITTHGKELVTRYGTINASSGHTKFLQVFEDVLHRVESVASGNDHKKYYLSKALLEKVSDRIVSQGISDLTESTRIAEIYDRAEVDEDGVKQFPAGINMNQQDTGSLDFCKCWVQFYQNVHCSTKDMKNTYRDSFNDVTHFPPESSRG